ncbi:hypothetical protein, partial [Streptomyces sp. NPDC017230]|uniref:hypothetical protein n=1 Tax=unclassified Streptomyces TaxID=2593676 RepID=UPI0037A840D9
RRQTSRSTARGPRSLRFMPVTRSVASSKKLTEYVTPGEGVINQIADQTEAQIISAARDDVAYALSMAELPEASRAELRLIVRKLAGTVRDIANVAELRGERLDEPVYGSAVRALSDALMRSFPHN